VTDLLTVLAATGLALLPVWALTRRLSITEDPPTEELLLPALHPDDVWHTGYLTARAMDRGLRATARRAGLLSLPAASLLGEDHTDGLLSVVNRAETRRRQDRIYAEYLTPFRRTVRTVLRQAPCGDGRPYQLDGQVLTRPDLEGQR